jgi:hypothetical protein
VGKLVLYDLLALVLFLIQAGFGAWSSRFIVSSRHGVSLRRWTVTGAFAGAICGPLFAWEFAGWRNGDAGLQQLRASRGTR